MRRLLVLGWHNARPTWYFPAPNGLAGLERQLRFLRRCATVVPLQPALDMLRAGHDLPPRAVALTFDDGYRDQLDDAARLLGQLKLPATFFLVPELLDGTADPWWERLAWAVTQTSRDRLRWEQVEFDLSNPRARLAVAQTLAEQLKRRPRALRDGAVRDVVERCAPERPSRIADMFLDWDGARNLVRLGFEVGSHSMRHDILTEQPARDQVQDLAASRQNLQRLGIPVDLLAYPNGTAADVDATTVAAAVAAGYRYGITTIPGLAAPSTEAFSVPRFVRQPERGVVGLARIAAHPIRRRIRPEHGSGGAPALRAAAMTAP